MEGENRQLQGQLTAIIQFEGQLISWRGAGANGEVRSSQALATIRAAEPKVVPASSVNALQALTNSQLKNDALNLAERMRNFNEKMRREVALASSGIAVDNGVVPPETEQQKQIYADNQVVYNHTFLSDAIATRDELWRRLERVPNIDLTPHNDAMSAFSSHLVGDHPIQDGAAYLEKLAHQLPAR